MTVSLTRATDDGLHCHFAVTGVREGRSIEVCARRQVLPLGPSDDRQSGEWNFWYCREDGLSREDGLKAIEEAISWARF